MSIYVYNLYVYKYCIYAGIPAAMYYMVVTIAR